MASDDTTSPVAAEGLRERIDDVIADWATNPRGRHLGDLVVAALAGDPGDLPARMAAEMRQHHHLDINHPEWAVADDTCECGETVTDWDAHRAAAAMGVRDEHLAATVAENAELRRREEHAVKEHQVTRERLAEARREVAELRRTPLAAEEEIRRLRAGLVTESRAADDVIADLEELIKTERQQHEATLAEVERLQAELAEAKASAESVHGALMKAYEQQNDAYAEVSWKRLDEQRERAEKAEAERDALKAAIAEAVKQIRKWMDPDDTGPLFAPGFASEVDRTLKRYIGEHVLAALAVPESHQAGNTKPKHIGNGANAEDCPACTGDIPYPWICPGEPEAPGDAETEDRP
jgi:hypothetical protein